MENIYFSSLYFITILKMLLETIQIYIHQNSQLSYLKVNNKIDKKFKNFAFDNTIILKF